MKFQLQDLFAGIAALILLSGVVILAIEGKEVSPALAGAAGAAVGYLFRGQVEVVMTSRRNGIRS